MTSWIQSSDFSSEDIKPLESFEDFEAYIDNLLKEQFDKSMQELEVSNREFCPWGIGVDMGTNFGLHVTREDYSMNTYTVLVQETVEKKLLGFIPISKVNEEWENDLSCAQMKIAVAAYYSRKQNMQDKTK
jgi:hypothetical protein